MTPAELEDEFTALLEQAAVSQAIENPYMQGGHKDYTPVDARDEAALGSRHWPTMYVPRATELGIPMSYNPHHLKTDMVVQNATTKEKTVLAGQGNPDALTKTETAEVYKMVKAMGAARGVYDPIALAPLAVKAFSLKQAAKVKARADGVSRPAPQPAQPRQPMPVQMMAMPMVAPAPAVQQVAAEPQVNWDLQPTSQYTAPSPVAESLPPLRRLKITMLDVGEFETYWTEINEDLSRNTLTLVFDARYDHTYWEPPQGYTKPFAVQEAGSETRLLVESTNISTKVGNNIVHILRILGKS